MNWSSDDVRFLKALRIDPWFEPERPARKTGEVLGRANTLAVFDIAIGLEGLEDAYVRAMIDPTSDRDTDGHPFISAAFFRLSPVARRANAIDMAQKAHERAERCKCGARTPSHNCFA